MSAKNHLESLISEIAHLGSISDPTTLADKLSVENLPYKNARPSDYPAIYAFRRLNKQARINLCQRVLNDILPVGPAHQDNPVISTYDCEVHVGGPHPNDATRVLQALNRAWGFPDGNCNQRGPNGTIIPKPGGDNPSLIDATYALRMNTRLTIRVTVYKNGHKSYRLLT